MTFTDRDPTEFVKTVKCTKVLEHRPFNMDDRFANPPVFAVV